MAEVPSETRFVGFVPGNAVAVVGGRTVALLETDPRSQLVADLSEAIRSDADLDLLTAILVGAGLRNLPPLALVQIEDGVARAILRGDIALTTRTTSNETGEEVRAGEVLTWVEHVVQDVEHVEIRRVGETSEISVFEFSEGVVPAARLEVTVAGGSPIDRSAPPPIPGNLQVPAGSVSDLVDPARANETVRYGEEVARAGTGKDVAGAEADEGDLSDNVQARNGALGDAEHDAAASPVDAEGRTLAVSGVQPDLVDPVDPDGAVDSDGAGAGGVDDEADDAGVDDAVDSEPEYLDGEADVPFPDESGKTLDPTSRTDLGDESDSDDGYDHLFGATEHRPLSLAGIDDDVAADAAAAVGLISSIPGGAPPPSTGGIPQGSPVAGAEGVPVGADQVADVGDHDGMTITLAQLRAAQGAGDPTPDSAAGSSAGSTMAEVVHAVSCPSGHLNPPAAASCRVCGVEIATQEHVSVPRPVLGVLRFANGEEYPLVRSILLGRSPKASGTSRGNQLPELITLDSPSKELSSTHLEIRLEGWQVLAIDRRSTNGTTVALPGRDPQRLHPGNAIPIVPGTVIDMAEEIQFTYEVTQ